MVLGCISRILLVLMSLLCWQGNAVAAKLFVIGDSVSAETHAGWAAGQGWGAVVASNAGLTEFNVAVAGTTTAQMQPQWDTVLANYAAGDTVSFMPGENDINVTLLASFRATLDGQIAAAITAGIPAGKITLHTPFIIQASPYQKAAPQYLQAIREIAFNRGVVLIDVYAHFAELSQTIGSITALYVAGDTQHPSPAGHAEIARLYSLLQNSGSAAYHTIASPIAIAAPALVMVPLHQAPEVGPTLLSAQVSYLDPAGTSAVSWNVQDFNAPGGEVGLQLDGSPFNCANSTTVTAAVFSRLMIVPVAHAHDIWVNANDGTYNSGGTDFAVSPP